MAMDFRDAKVMKERPDTLVKSGIVHPRWWEVDEEERAQNVVDVGRSLKSDSASRLAAHIRHARMYENCEIESLQSRDYSDAIVRQIITASGLMSLNVGAACVDTLTAKITKNRPRPEFLTSGASWDMKVKAENLDKWCQGFFYQTKIYRKARQVFIDGCEFGTGFLYIFPCEDGRLDCERVLPSEIFVDDLDGQYSAPRQMIRLKYVSRDVLTRLFPKHAEKIANAGKKEKTDTIHAQAEVIENTIEVWEAWHLPSGEKAKDGRHAICIDGACLLDERWKISCFPFVVYRFKQRTAGFWGKGVIETVQGIQIELNRVVRSLAQQTRRKGKGRTFVPLGSKVSPAHLTNADGGDYIYFTGGVPPIVDNSNAIAPEDFNLINLYYQKAFQEAGISELSAASKKPAGLDAAVALREYSDIESERFAPQHQEWEQLFMDFAETAIELITKQYGWQSYKVLVPGRRDLLEVDWAEINLDRDSYVMQMWPVSNLPQTPAARLQRVKEMMEAGFITKAQAQRLLEFPDIEAESNLANAVIDDADATISAILDDKTPKLMPLEPYQNYDMIIERSNAAYLYARHRGCPEERLALLRNLIDNATAAKAALMQPPPGPMNLAPPGAAPGPMMGGGISVENNVAAPAAPNLPLVPPVIG